MQTLPQGAWPPPRGVRLDVQMGNGVTWDTDAAAFARGEPSALWLAHTAASCAAAASQFRAKMDSPGERQAVSAASRAAGLTPRILDALALAYAEPIPSWLCAHLFRNGISFAAFDFELGADTEAELRQFAADMRALVTLASPPFGALARTLRRLRRDISLPRVPPATAAGPLPPKFELVFLVTTPKRSASGRAQVTFSQLVHWAFSVRLNATPAATAMLAWQEAHLLAPANARVPHEVTFCGGSAAAAGEGVTPGSHASALLRLLSAFAHTTPEPCAICGARVHTILYHADSPTWRGVKALLRDVAFTGGAAQPGQVICRCVGCSRCGVAGDDVALKVCSACNAARYCSRACQKEDWSEHKGNCRHLSGVRAKLAAAASEAAAAPAPAPAR
jgi:hypothetical protein